MFGKPVTAGQRNLYATYKLRKNKKVLIVTGRRSTGRKISGFFP